MNITFLSCAHTNCGIGRYSEELSKALKRSGHYVNGFRKEGPTDIMRTYPYRSLKNLRHYIAPYFLNKAIKNEYSTIWQADYVDAAFALSQKKLDAERSLLFTTVHDAIPFIYPTSPASFWYYKKQLHHAAAISEKLIVVSHHAKKDLIQYAGILPEKIEVVHNGINHSQFFPDEKKIVNDVFTIRYVGGLGGHKNVGLLLEMAQILEREGLNFRLEIAGGNPNGTPLPKKVQSLRLKNVHFVGFVADSEIRTFLAGADLFVFPSLYEGFGFPPLEAMACGTATLASNRGSLPEVLSYGALISEPNPEAFALSVKSVYSDAHLKTSLEKRAISISANYTWEKTAQKMSDLYERALQKRSPLSLLSAS